MSKLILTLVFAALGAYFLRAIGSAWFTGEIKARDGWGSILFSRETEPVRFWGYFCLYCVLIIACIGMIIMLFLKPIP